MQHKVDLEKLLNNAFEEEEIQEGMQKANIEKEFLTPKILEKSSEILEAGAKEIKELDNLEIRLQVSEKELSEVRLPPQKILLYLDKIKSRKSFLYLGLTVIGFTIFGYLGSGSLYIAYKVLISILLLVGISGIIFFVLYKLINWLYSRKLKRIRDAKRKELEMVELEERIRSAEQTVEKAVFENGILPELRSLLNVLLTPSYDTSLTPLMAPGLAESYTSAYEIPTESKKKA